MIRTLCLVLAGLVLALPAWSQSPAQLRAELRTKESAAGKDADKLLEVAKWAEERGLAAEAKRLLQAALRIDPNHEGANLAAGNVHYDGKWMPAKDAEALRKKAQEAEFKAKGLVEVDGVWVEKDKVADAKKGIFHHAGQKLTRLEMQALQAGKVRHPHTGEFIDPADLDKAQTMFQIGTEGRWASEQEADVYHRDLERPWVIRTAYCVLVTTLPMKVAQEARREIDLGYETVRPFLGGGDPNPAHRPVVIVAATEDQHRDLGNQMGDEGSSYGAFLGTGERPFTVSFLGDVIPAVCHWHKDWGPYYARHAAGLAYCNSMCLDAGAEVPRWFLQSFGSYASRFTNPYLAGYFGEQHVQKGGVKTLKSWFNGFAINGEMEAKDIDANIYQAGLMLSFATQGGDAKVTEAMLEVTAEFTAGKGKAVAKAIEKLQKLLVDREDAIKGHLQKLVREKGR